VTLTKHVTLVVVSADDGSKGEVADSGQGGNSERDWKGRCSRVAEEHS
jgi:hypothetical protein